jgi:dolichol-phosphate mannosyltransferase
MARISVVIPSYKVIDHIEGVIAQIPTYVETIYVVDDCCPNNSGEYVQKNVFDPRVRVLFNEVNKGVGGAVVTGYKAAIHDGMDIVVKIDGDGQMDPNLIEDFITPIIDGDADYTKGNRFYNLEQIHQMPKIRLFGNAILSLLTKMSSGYWDLFDPTNGYTAVHSDALKRMQLDKLSERYFFESDMLFRLNIIRAKVIDVPMDAVYGDEVSNLKVSKVIGEFAKKNIKNICKRVFYNYYLRDMSAASVELLLSIPLIMFGLVFGIYHWISSIQSAAPASTGTVMLAVLPIVLGVQLLLSFLSYDIQTVPRRAIHRRSSRMGKA